MGYQNVGTPRFYINDLTYSQQGGEFRVYDSGDNPNQTWASIFDGNPSSTTTIPFADSAALTVRFTRVNRTGNDVPNYIALLGHNLNEQVMGMRHYYNTYFDPPAYGWNGGHGLDEIANGENGAMILPDGTSHSEFLQPSLDGFSICEISAPSVEDYTGYSSVQFYQTYGSTGQKSLKIGSIFMGKYYDMPHSFDLSLTMSHSYEGIKQITTKGGSTLSNASYYKSPKWGDLEAWELFNPNPAATYSKPYQSSSRRTWDLSFSFVSDKNLEPYNYTGYEWSSDTDTNIQAELPAQDNFFSDVLRYTMGGHLPFIFCPDPSIDYFDADEYSGLGLSRPPRVPEFAICRFDMNTFKRTQVAHKMYTISVKLRETW